MMTGGKCLSDKKKKVEVKCSFSDGKPHEVIPLWKECMELLFSNRGQQDLMLEKTCLSLRKQAQSRSLCGVCKCRTQNLGINHCILVIQHIMI